jgi:hypothetical protein
MGKDAIMKKDLDLKPEDIKDKDILISLGKKNSLLRIKTLNISLYYIGGDGTFLRTSGLI